MRAKVLSLAAAVAFCFAACKKVDKQLLTDVSTFETDWTKFVNDATSWGETLKTECEKVSTGHKDSQTAMMKWSSGLKGKDKMKCDSLMGVCHATEGKCTSMQAEFITFKTSLDETQATFGEWKAKVEKGEVENDAARTELDNYKAKLADAQGKLSSWGEMWAKTAADHKSSEDMCMAMMNKK